MATPEMSRLDMIATETLNSLLALDTSKIDKLVAKQTELLALAKKKDELVSLAESATALASLAESAEALASLAERAEDILALLPEDTNDGE